MLSEILSIEERLSDARKTLADCEARAREANMNARFAREAVTRLHEQHQAQVSAMVSAGLRAAAGDSPPRPVRAAEVTRLLPRGPG